jgi:hypothetical protein
MRLFGFLVFALGLVLMLAPRLVTDQLVDREIARAVVFENGEFKPFEIDLGPSRAPLAIVVRIEEGGDYEQGSGMAALTLVASHDGRSAFAGAVAFDNADWIEPENDQTSANAVLYEKRIGRIAELFSGTYRFTAAEGDAEAIALQRVELILRANSFGKPDLTNLAIAMVWIGAILWFIGQRRRVRRMASTPVKPERPDSTKWGRQ